MKGGLVEGIIANKNYLSNIPETLGKGELEYEMLEREKRKRNMVIRGIKKILRGYSKRTNVSERNKKGEGEERD